MTSQTSYPLKYRIARVQLQNHPILEEGFVRRFNYYSILRLVLQSNSEVDKEWLADSMAIYQKLFEIPNSQVKLIDQLEPQVHIKKVTQEMYKVKNVFNAMRVYHRDYIHLLVTEIILLSIPIKQTVNDELIELLFSELHLTDFDFMNIEQFCLSLFKGFDYRELENKFGYKNPDLNYILNAYYQAEHTVSTEENQNVSVIANMGAGKSTLLNTLIATNIFPSENKACTAKLLKYTYNPSVPNIHGITYGTDEEFRRIVREKDLKRWNENDGITHVLIEGDAGTYTMLNSGVSFIDTPGANNSLDHTHREITVKHLQEVGTNTILYLLNATNMAITDDVALLKNVTNHVPVENIIFVLNKMDQLDVEAGDDIVETIDVAVTYLQENGIDNPIVIPVSTYAAQIFKRVLNGDQLTRREKRDFVEYYELFQEEAYDFSRYANVKTDSSVLTYGQAESTIECNHEYYSTTKLLQLLKNTGIQTLEYLLINIEPTLERNANHDVCSVKV